MKISLVLLAVGNSRRFGGNKLLENIDGTPMYLHIVNEVEMQGEALFCQKIIVTQYEKIASAMEKRGYIVVKNPHSELGISSSVKLGLARAESGAFTEGAGRAVCFAVCDQPYLKGNTVRLFLKEWEKSGKGMGCVSFQGKLGNPAVFSEKYFKELRRLEGDKGGKKVISMYPEDVYIYETEDRRELEDIDIRRNL